MKLSEDRRQLSRRSLSAYFLGVLSNPTPVFGCVKTVKKRITCSKVVTRDGSVRFHRETCPRTRNEPPRLRSSPTQWSSPRWPSRRPIQRPKCDATQTARPPPTKPTPPRSRVPLVARPSRVRSGRRFVSEPSQHAVCNTTSFELVADRRGSKRRRRRSWSPAVLHCQQYCRRTPA